MITARNLVHAVLWMVLNFASIAVLYITLSAPFVSMVQIAVYAGAIMVLFLFVIMLLNLNRTVEPRKRTVTRIAAVASGGLFLLTLLGAIKNGVQITPAAEFNAGTGLVKSVGQSLFGPFLVPFELSSVLFLSAIIGAVTLGRKETGVKPMVKEGDEYAGLNQPERVA